MSDGVAVASERDEATQQAAAGAEPVPSKQEKELLNAVFRSMKRTADLFSADWNVFPTAGSQADDVARAIKRRQEYGLVLKAADEAKRQKEDEILRLPAADSKIGGGVVDTAQMLAIGNGPSDESSGDKGGATKKSTPSGAVSLALPTGSSRPGAEDNTTRSLLPARAPMMVKPTWHAPWKLYRVISGHTGWVRAVDVEPGNEWFATGGGDRIIKIWELASGKLKLSLTGHISAVRAVKISDRHPFLFSGGEDKQVKCWDLETNKVVRHYHGHLSALQSLAVHPTLDVLITTSRDATARVWDMRTKAQVHCLAAHSNTVSDVVAQAMKPQVITSSHDSTVRLWDLAMAKTITTLTHHKKSVRALALHPRYAMFASGSPDNIKQWRLPDGEFQQNLAGHNAIVNALACNADGVLVSGADNGSMCFWDWRSGFCYQREQTKPQPGSIDPEAGVYALTFDRTGLRLISAEADKTIKMWKPDDTATEETHPIVWRPEIVRSKIF